MIIWHTASVLNALYGGLLIGLAATLLLVFNGRIAGISGIVAGLLTAKHSNFLWRALFIIGLLLAPFVYRQFLPLPTVHLTFNSELLIIAGLLVGFGTRLANGCTSGHGVCGIARLSVRSIVATITFILTGAMTVYVVRILQGA